MKEAVAIFGSARRNGNTGKLIDWIARELNINIIDLSAFNISPYDYEHRNINDDFVPLMKSLACYKQLLFVTPVYWYGPSAQMKTFIDRTSDFLDVEELGDIGRNLRNKSAYVVCTSISHDADEVFLGSFEKTFKYLGMKYGGYIHANCSEGYQPEKYRDNLYKFIEQFT